uniref:Protein TolB n=1 Tax=Anthurium amnicola TaxID=1678845 RepID=A0A1D1Z6D9_9ARAE
MVSGKVMVVVVSTGVVSTAVVLRVWVPAIAVFLCSEVPRIYGAVLLWLTPPYLYFLINLIIISIAASSRFHKADAAQEEEPPTAPPAEIQPRVEDPPAPVMFLMPAESKEVEVTEEEEEFVISRSSWTPKRRRSWEVAPPAEKPLVSVRFAARRGAPKASPEGRALGVAKPRKGETLESTWKAITDGRTMPLARHLKKSDTWGADGGRERDAAAAAGAATTPVRKSETFRERQAGDPSPSPGGSGRSSGRLRREASLGQDELNRRVEAFINKFNEEMRLQRQESFKHYMGMINRGSH